MQPAGFLLRAEGLPCSAGRQFCRLLEFGYLCFNSYFCLSAFCRVAGIFSVLFPVGCGREPAFIPNSVSL